MLNYAYYDENGRTIAIVYPDTPKEMLEYYRRKYDEVRFEENYKTRKLKATQK